MDPNESLERESIRQRGSLIALVGTTTRVFEDCLLSNGALIEAPSQLPSYPATARDGFRVRPGRELALAILAMDGLGRDVRPILLPWLFEHAESFDEEGVLRFVYDPIGALLDANFDSFGMIFLHSAVARNPESEIAKRVIDRLLMGSLNQFDVVEGDRQKINSESAAVNLAWLSDLPDFNWMNDEKAIWKHFLFIAAEAESRNRESARRDFLKAIDSADMDGHFAESKDDPAYEASPTPYLLSHLCFVLAAQRTGELDLIPKSGYTGRRRF